MNKSVFIIGYMGCGKSSIGKKISNKLKYKFIDTDKEIEKIVGLSVDAIFKTYGENKFRELEHSVLQAIINQDKIVVATGGGLPCYYNNMDIMNFKGITIFIDLSLNKIINRLKQSKVARPILENVNPKLYKEFIVKHLELRRPFYEKAKFVYRDDDIDADKIVADIIMRL